MKPQVFLSYAREDLDSVRKFYADLKKRKVNIWFDKEDLGPGRWKKSILKAIARSTFFVICISQAALRKTGDEPGFVDEELHTAWEIAQAQSDTAFTIIPVRLEDCDRGDHRLSVYHQYDLFKDWDGVLDRLAVRFGGFSLSDKQATDERTADQKMIERLQSKADAYYFAGDYAKALSLFNVVAGQEEEALGKVSVHILLKKGVVLAGLDRHEEALEAFDKALEINLDYADAWSNKGVVLAGLDRYEEALAACDKALEINPDFANAWYNKGVDLAGLDRDEEALAAYDKALKINPDFVNAWSNKGAALGRLDRHEEALAAYDKALKINPDYTDAWYNKGAALRHLDRNEEALVAFDKALEINPDDAEALLGKQIMLQALGLEG